MRRMVDDKEMISINNRITALESKPSLYEHLVFVSGKLQDAGVTTDDFTFTCKFRILNNNSTAITASTLASTISRNSIPATGYTHYTSNESEYTIFSIETNVLDRTILQISTIPTEYTPAGAGSSTIGEITLLVDRVNKLL